MTREERIDWLCRLRSSIQVYIPKEWASYMETALSEAIDREEKDVINRVLDIIDDADKEAGDKTYIVLDDGFFCSQARYIKEKMLELLEE